MGAGGSAQNDGQRRGSNGKQTPASVTAMKKTVVAPLPNAFPVTDFDAVKHQTLAGKGVGIVRSPEEVQSIGVMPRPQDPVLSAVDDPILQHAAVGAGGSLQPNQQQQYRWFAEDLDRVGVWEPYNNESSQRLESAFMSRKETCLVTLRRRAYTVNLLLMRQLPEGAATLALDGAGTGVIPASSPGGVYARASGVTLPQQRVRRVLRALAKITVNATTGEEESVEIITGGLVDPFTDDADNAAEGAAAAATPGDNDAILHAAKNRNTTFPRFTKVAYPSNQPLYALDISPRSEWLSAEARAVGIDSGMHILSGGKDGRLAQWDATTGNVVTRYAVTASRPTCVLVARFSPSAKYVVAGCDDNDARVYRVGQPSPTYMLKGHTHKVYGISVLAGEAQLLTGSMDAHVRVWDLATGACLRKEQCHSSHVFTTAASLYDPNFCLSAGNDAILCAHDLRAPNSVVMRLRGHTATLWDCAMYPGEGGHNTQLASAGMDTTVRLWDPRQPDEPFRIIRHHTKPVHSISYMPNGCGLLSASKDSFVHLFDTSSGAMVWRAKAQTSSAFRVLYHPDRHTIVTSGVSGLVNQWDWPHGAVW